MLPPADGSLRVVGQPAGNAAAVVSFTGHIVVAADIRPEWVRERLRPGQLSEAYLPPFLGALAEAVGRRVNAIDMVLVAPPLRPATEPPLTERDLDHPRVRRARRYRRDVRVWTTDGGVVSVGRGLAGRWEVGLEVADGYRGRGLGRALATAARGLVPDGRPIWAQVAPGNAASVRAFLAAGYAPVGMEAMLVP